MIQGLMIKCVYVNSYTTGYAVPHRVKLIHIRDVKYCSEILLWCCSLSIEMSSAYFVSSHYWWPNYLLADEQTFLNEMYMYVNMDQRRRLHSLLICRYYTAIYKTYYSRSGYEVRRIMYLIEIVLSVYNINSCMRMFKI